MKLFFRFLPIMLALFVVMPVEAKKKKYPNGDFYEGKWKKGTPHGLGTMTYANGNVYTGNWEFGQYSGQGKLTYAQTSDTISYEGIWLNGKPNGEGELLLSNGDSYIGRWKNGALEGFGTFISSDQNCYEGNWLDGNYNGMGKFTTHNGDLFAGIWSRGKLIVGTIEYSDGTKYQGNFENGRLVKGKYFNHQGLQEGNFENGEFVSGKYTSQQGLQEGVWKNGIFWEGSGKITQDGVWYDGVWKEGKFRNGKIKGAFGPEKFDGIWKDGKFSEGKCELVFSSPRFEGFKGIKDKTGYHGVLSVTSDLIVKGSFNHDFILNGEYTVENEYTEFKMIADIQNDQILKAKGSFFLYDDLNFTIEQEPSGNNRIKIYKNNTLYKSGKKGELNVSNVENMVLSFIPRKHFDMPTTSTSSNKINKRNEISNENSLHACRIKLRTPGSILSHISVEKLSYVTNLIISGYMDDNDIAVLNKCTSLKSLDLSGSYMKLSPETIKEREEDEGARDLILGLIGLGSLAKIDNIDPKTDYYKIPNSSFVDLYNLESISFPRNVKVIGFRVCSNCRNLKQVILPPNLKTISANAFENCTSLKNIKFPKTLSYLGYNGNNEAHDAFTGCSNLEEIDLSKCVFSYTEWRSTFEGCHKLKKVCLPENIKSIRYAPKHSNVHLYFPRSLTLLEDQISGLVLHFKSFKAPKARTLDHIYQPTKCIIYVPKGSVTSYYNRLGDKNKYIEY